MPVKKEVPSCAVRYDKFCFWKNNRVYFPLLILFYFSALPYPVYVPDDRCV